ncbi:hypothetical protein BBC27_12095 [Acidithiobacillus ferrivorans]|uniref:Uncharacterized protein n=1 Tax=Acidithiobacillus ferrivorans TaxID=160808 RepID=A0A1B9BY72_9PROT|nr:hypothetical protein [Acidithiobacillus ferrivorans]OCB02657.1 hypothetical protein BBC27_12095 [Acidithiobacillus ferrivorans]
MKYRFSSNEDKWTTVMDVADIILAQRDEEQRIAVEKILEEMAAIGAVTTSINEITGRTLYKYDNTDLRARMIMKGLACNEKTSVQ